MNPIETIKAVDLVRRIRDRQSHELEGVSEAHILEFYRLAGMKEKRAAAERALNKHPQRPGVF
jgi:hypothetical protein